MDKALPAREGFGQALFPQGEGVEEGPDKSRQGKVEKKKTRKL